MTSSVTARACANIALCKYWGKQGPGNAPATPSISLTLAELVTETTVTAARGADAFELNGRALSGADLLRMSQYLDLWREQGLISGSFEVLSSNYCASSGRPYPTAAGLASSAGGFAALATALSGHATRRLTRLELGRLARRGSGSAARSIHGGLAALAAGKDPAGRQLAGPAKVPWGMVVVVVEAPPKEIGSREGMELSRLTSPFYRRWVLADRFHYREMASALRGWDLNRVGELLEENMLAMHACMLTTRPPLLYWAPASLSVIQAVRRWRATGVEAYATTDAGAHVALLCRLEDLPVVAVRTRELAEEGVAIRDVIESEPGGPAEMVARA